MAGAGSDVPFLSPFRLRESRERRGARGDGESGRKLKVAATLFPYYDFVRQVAGDQVELSLVIPAGMDSHSFEPTPKGHPHHAGGGCDHRQRRGHGALGGPGGGFL